MKDTAKPPVPPSIAFAYPIAAAAARKFTFEALRQWMERLGGDDPVTVSPVERDVKKAVLALLDPGRDPAAVERTLEALVSALADSSGSAYEDFLDESLLPADPDARQSLLDARRNVFANWLEFADGMTRVGPTICQVLLDGNPNGSGFLIGRRHILTAHHTVNALIEGGKAAADSHHRLRIRFDNVLIAGQGSMRSEFPVTRDWLVVHSIDDDDEFSSEDPPESVKEGCLDFAVVRLAEAVGDVPPRYRPSEPRKWIDLNRLSMEPQKRAGLLIAHHPGGADLKLSVGLCSGHDDAKTRVRYQVPTQIGSSGAPCFTMDWKAYALHNAGYRGVNHGVPLALIKKAIDAGGGLNDATDAPVWILPPVLASGDAMLGRQDIAATVDGSLRRSLPVTTLIVTSDAQGGKSVTGAIIRDLVIDRGHVAFFLDSSQFATDIPETFATRLVTQVIGKALIGQPHSPDMRQRARWVTQQLAHWTREELARDTRKSKVREGDTGSIWIILDNLDKVTLPPETHDLLVALVADEGGDGLNSVRYVLLGYGGELSSAPQERLSKTKLDLVRPEEMVHFMRYTLQLLGRHESAEETAASAQGLFATVRAIATPSAQILGKALASWANQRRVAQAGEVT